MTYIRAGHTQLAVSCGSSRKASDVVVLPAPLGPSTTEDRSTADVKPMWSTAVKAPNF